jgi:hypothetical protein
MEMSTNDTGNDDDRGRGDKPESDPALSSERDPLGHVLDSFIERFRRGERPSLTGYLSRYPSFADEIRELLPALVEIEQLGSLGGRAW